MDSDVRTDGVAGMYRVTNFDNEKHDLQEDNTVEHVAEGVIEESIGLRTLLPCRNASRPNNEHPIEYAGFFSFVGFMWMDRFMWRTFRHGLKPEDLWTCPPVDKASRNASILERMWTKELETTEKPSLFRVVMLFGRSWIVVGMLLMMIGYAFLGVVVQPYIYMKLLEYLNQPDGSIGYGVALVIGVFCVQVGFTAGNALAIAVSTVMAIRIRAAISFIVYKKILRMKCLGGRSTGFYVDIFANESTRIFEGFTHLPKLMASPWLIISPSIYALVILREYALIGIAFLLIMFPIQVLVGKLISRVRQNAIPLTDKRVSMMKETLENIKSLKMFAWEKPFSQIIQAIRKREMTNIAYGNIVLSFTIVMSTILNGMAIMITITILVLYGKTFTYIEIFTFVVLYSSIVDPYDFCMTCLKYVSECRVALHRCQKIMELPDSSADHNKPSDANLTNGYVIAFHNSVFTWPSYADYNEYKTTMLEPDTQKTFYLSNICLKIESRCTLGIAGPVGSGKSALIKAMLGELEEIKGSCCVMGSVAYIPQQPWIFNATLRENILFHLPFDRERYFAILDACCLLRDINTLSNGDLTEIGERGVNLSGGQKNRVNIARALYSDRDIVLMDDPFSALDPDIADSVFTKAVLGLLKEKTVVMVTHQMHFMSRCDHILYMDRGEIRSQGSHSEMIRINDAYARYFSTVDSFKCITSEMKFNDKNHHSDESEPTQALMVEETSQEGAVTLKTYWAYISAAGGIWALLLALLVSVLAEGIRAFSFWWLGVWLSDGNGNSTVKENVAMQTHNGTTETSIMMSNISSNPNVEFYVLVYGLSLIGIIIAYSFRSIIIMKLMETASKRLHSKLFKKVFRSPMSFFDTTPIGQIINRFSKDQDEIDACMPPEIDNVLKILTRILLYLILIGAILHWFLLAIPVMFLVFIMFYMLYHAGVTEMKRYHSKSWSPLLGLVSNSIYGLSCVRAYDRTERSHQQFCAALDHNTATLIGYYLIRWWNMQRLVLITGTTISIMALILVLLKSQIDPEMAGVAISYGLQISGMVHTLVLITVETQSRFTAVERIKDYIDTLQQEEGASSEQGRSNWPKSGRIMFENYNMRYRPRLPLVLKDLSFVVEDGEKVAVVGRTGAGKSSLSNALFRLCESAGGKILIDSVDISSLSLEQLRSNISIIPQEPVLFSGSIRGNIDPFDEHSDSELWEALEKCHLKSKVVSLEGELGAKVNECGNNLSVGEKQLLCLTRVLLKRTKILLLDEATASVDTETSLKLQHCLHKVFENCTMLVIAHRLETVMDCQKILVIDGGKVVEFDEAAILANDSKSHFHRLMIGTADDTSEMHTNKSIFSSSNK